MAQGEMANAATAEAAGKARHVIRIENEPVETSHEMSAIERNNGNRVFCDRPDSSHYNYSPLLHHMYSKACHKVLRLHASERTHSQNDHAVVTTNNIV